MSNPSTFKRGRLLRYQLAVLKYFIGVVLCQYMLGAIVVVGWTTRLMQRQILLSWWKRG